MKLSIQSLINATRLHLGPEVATALETAVGLQRSSVEITVTIQDAKVGQLLSQAVGARTDVGSIQLHSAHLYGAGAPVSLEAGDALSHPLLLGLPESLAEAISAPIIAGARAHFLAPGALTFVGLKLTDARGVVGGTLEFRCGTTAGQLTGVALYGAPLQDEPLVTTRTISAAALYAIGQEAREPMGVPRPSSGGELAGLNLASGTGSLN